MNLSDLTEVLRDHAQPSDTVVNARLAGVRAKVAASRRRRAVGAAACVVLALVGVVYAVIPRSGWSSEPALHVRSFPEYQLGTRLAGQAWADVPSSSVALRFVPTTLDFKVFVKCDVGKNVDMDVKVEVNGKAFRSGGCGGATGVGNWGAWGVEIGKAVLITMTVRDEVVDYSQMSPVTMAMPSSGTFGLGVGEAVPVDEYPFPPRPETLEAMPPFYTEPAVVVSADPVDPNARREVTTTWPGERLLHARLNAPGRVRVLVNDVQLVDYFHWDYKLGETQTMPSDSWEADHGLKLLAGDPVRITVIPEDVSGDWEVWVGGY
jgi:hypothetical protein